jgi:hypothetical protein
MHSQGDGANKQCSDLLFAVVNRSKAVEPSSSRCSMRLKASKPSSSFPLSLLRPC